jgi:small-conductance mechanosensitive channel
VLLVALLMLPLLSAVGAAVGYYYTAQEMAHRLGQTARLALIVLLIHALLRRAFFVAQRRLAHERARRKRAAAAARLAEQPGMVALLAVTDPAPQICFARAGDVALDMNQILRAAAGPHGGRGGGRPQMAQGGGVAGEALEAVLAAARAQVAP